MSTFVSDDVRIRMDNAPSNAAQRGLRIVARDQTWPIKRMWDAGFALTLDTDPNLRGFVDIYDGDAHLFQCLIVATEVVGQELHFGLKRMTAIRDHAPLDFAPFSEADALEQGLSS